MSNRLAVHFLDRIFEKPFLPASGCYSNAREGAEWHDLRSCWGALISKSVTLEPRAGNPGHRLAEAPAGLLNSIGLQNPGIDVFLSEILPSMQSSHPEVIVNIAGSSSEEYIALIERLNEVEIAAIEVNLSCPNVSTGCMAIGTDPAQAQLLMSQLSRRSRHPLIAKLSPNVASIQPIVQAVEAGGAAGISLVNTFLGLSLDIRRRRPVFQRRFAGYSGPGIQPIALRLAAEACQATHLPVIGLGGITTAEDVIAFLMVGCHLVQLGTALLKNPTMITALGDEVIKLMDELGFATVEEVRGSVIWDL